MDSIKEITKYQADLKLKDKKKSKSLDDPIVAALKAVEDIKPSDKQKQKTDINVVKEIAKRF